MKSKDNKLTVFMLITVLLLLLDIFVTNILNDYIGLFSLFILLLLTIFIFGKKKNRKLYEKDVILNICIYAISYYLIIYLSGIFIGFLRSGYSLQPMVIVSNMLPVIIGIVLTELYRYQIVEHGRNNKFLIVLSFVICTFIDVKLISYAYDLETLSGIIKLVYMAILPLISKNILLTYMSYKFGYRPCIIYRAFMELPVYILPIVPKIDDYFSTIIDLIFPALILYLIYREFRVKRGSVDVRGKIKHNRLISVVSIALIILVITLTSGLFKYYALAIGSESMEPKIRKGDLVIVRKMNKDEFHNFKLGEVLVYKHNDMVVVHRIVKIIHNDDNYYFRTKGDNNSSEDMWTIDERAVIGEAVLKIPYIGIPTVWLSERV